MNLAVLPGVLVYFGVGWILSDLIGDDRDELKIFVFIFWPLIIGLLLFYIIVMVTMLLVIVVMKIADQIAKLMERG